MPWTRFKRWTNRALRTAHRRQLRTWDGGDLSLTDRRALPKLRWADY